MVTPFERNRRRTRTRGTTGVQKSAMPYAAALLNDYQGKEPIPFTTVDSVNVNQEILQQKRQQEIEQQKQKLRGPFSGIASLAPQVNRDKGFGFGTEDYALPLTEPAKGGPWKFVLEKAIAPTLQKWQEVTEWTAGTVSTPFSTELQAAANAGISAGERWRNLDLPTKRIGKPSGEGFGFNVGVKGAVEMLVDPIGWATTVIPVGLVFKPAAYASKRLGQAAAKVTRLQSISDKGAKKFAERATKFDKEIATEMSKIEKDIAQELVQRNTLAGNGFGKLEDTTTIIQPKSEMNLLMDYTTVMDNKQQLGFFDGISAYINQKATAGEKKKGGVFFRMLDNPIQKFRPSVAALQTKEGRALYYFNQYKTAIPTEARLLRDEIIDFNEDVLFDLKPGKVQKVLPNQAKDPEGVDLQSFYTTMKFYKAQIARETIPVNIFNEQKELAISSPMYKIITNIKDVAEITPDTNIIVNYKNGVANISNRQGFQLGTFDFKFLDEVLGSEDTIISKLQKGYNISQKEAKRLRKSVHSSINQMVKKADAAGATTNIYQKNVDNVYDNLSFAGFTFTPLDTIIYKVGKGEEQLGRRKRIGSFIDSLTEEVEQTIKTGSGVEVKNRKVILNNSRGQLQRANRTYKNTIREYLNDFNNLDDAGKIALDPKSIAGRGVAATDDYAKLVNEIPDFNSIDEALIGLRNLDNGLSKGQLRVNLRKVVNEDEAAESLSRLIGEDEMKGITRELIRQIGIEDGKRLDFLGRTDNIINGQLNDLFKRSDAFDGEVVYKQLEQQFGKQQKRVGDVKKQSDMKDEFRKIYDADIEAVFEKEMPWMQFVDMAGFVVGHSHRTGRPIRLWETGYFVLKDEQKEYLDRVYSIMDEGGMMAREQGALGAMDDIVEMKTSNYFHHVVEEFGNATVEYLEGLGATMTGKRGTAALAAQSSFQKRSYRDFITEGFEEQGLQYSQEVANVVQSFVESTQTAVANTHVVNKLKKVGTEVKELLNIKNQTAKQAGFRKSIDAVRQISNAMREPLSDADSQSLRKLYQEDEAARGIIRRAVGDDAKEFDKIFGTDDPDFAGNAGRFLGREKVDDLIEGFTKQEQTEKYYLQRINEAALEGRITKTEQAKFGRTKQVVLKRGVTRYTGAPENVNVDVLKDILFDDNIAKKIENTLGISEPTRFEKFAETTGSIGDVFRLFQTGIDLGTPLLQGLPTLVTKPSVWAKSTGQMLKGLFSEEAGAVARREFFLQNKQKIRKMNSIGILMSGQGNDYYRALDKDSLTLKTLSNQGFSPDGKVVKSARLIKEQGFDRFQNAFEDFGDRIRLGLFEAHEQQILSSLDDVGKSAYRTGGVSAIEDSAVRKEFKELGEYINQMTGAFSHTQNMISRRQANFERAFLLFSPSYTRASAGLIGSAMTGGLKGDQAYRAISNMLMVGVGMHTAYAFSKSAAEGEPLEKYLRLDPSRSDFLTADISGVKVGVGSFWNSSAKLLANIASDPAFRGDVLDSPLLLTGAGRGQAGFDEQGIRQKVGNNPLVRWLRGRAAPVGSHFWNLGMGSTPLGEELDPISVDNAQEIATSIAPFWIQSVFDADNKVKGLTAIPAEFIGLRTYETPAWEKRRELRNDLAYAHYGKLWRNLTTVQKRNVEVVESTSPNGQRLNELDAEIKAKRQEIGGSELDELLEDYNEEKEVANNIYKAEMEEASLAYREGGVNEAGEFIFGSPADYIKFEKHLRGQRNARYETIDIDPDYQNVQLYYDSFSQFDKLEVPEDYFAKKYADIYFDPEWDKANYYDFVGRDAAIQDLLNSWGGNQEELKAYATNSIFGAKITDDNDPSGVLAEYYLGQYKYFDLYYKGAHDSIFQNKYQGQLDEAYEQWRTSNQTDKQNILKKNQLLRKAFSEVGNVREALRTRDANLDAFMYRFRVGGITSLMNPLNRNREEELQQLTAMEVYTPQWRVAGT
tara:strand:+ start:1529 stop:7363 length:5835 start_codon:yes stop_codon:yes gene_type:complete